MQSTTLTDHTSCAFPLQSSKNKDVLDIELARLASNPAQWFKSTPLHLPIRTWRERKRHNFILNSMPVVSGTMLSVLLFVGGLSDELSDPQEVTGHCNLKTIIISHHHSWVSQGNMKGPLSTHILWSMDRPL